MGVMVAQQEVVLVEAVVAAAESALAASVAASAAQSGRINTPESKQKSLSRCSALPTINHKLYETARACARPSVCD